MRTLSQIQKDIDAAKLRLKKLQAEKMEVIDAGNEIRWEGEKKKKDEKHRQSVEMLRLASIGKSLRELAKTFGISETTAKSRIWKAWRKEFPSHYKVWSETSYTERLGLLTALRESPPLFTKR